MCNYTYNTWLYHKFEFCNKWVNMIQNAKNAKTAKTAKKAKNIYNISNAKNAQNRLKKSGYVAGFT